MGMKCYALDKKVTCICCNTQVDYLVRPKHPKIWKTFKNKHSSFRIGSRVDLLCDICLEHYLDNGGKL